MCAKTVKPLRGFGNEAGDCKNAFNPLFRWAHPDKERRGRPQFQFVCKGEEQKKKKGKLQLGQGQAKETRERERERERERGKWNFGGQRRVNLAKKELKLRVPDAKPQNSIKALNLGY